MIGNSHCGIQMTQSAWGHALSRGPVAAQQVVTAIDCICHGLTGSVAVVEALPCRVCYILASVRTPHAACHTGGVNVMFSCTIGMPWKCSIQRRLCQLASLYVDTSPEARGPVFCRVASVVTKHGWLCNSVCQWPDTTCTQSVSNGRSCDVLQGSASSQSTRLRKVEITRRVLQGTIRPSITCRCAGEAQCYV